MSRRFVLPALMMLPMWGHVPASAGDGGPAPPQSRAFGKSLAEWQRLYWTWALGGDQAGRVRNVAFLPLPEGELVAEEPLPTFVGELDVTLDPGTAFVLPVFTFVGESYVEGAPDDEPLPAEVFTGAVVRVELDGKPLLRSGVDDLGRYYFGPVDFDPPIAYAEPQPRGDVTAAGAIWVQGIGFVHHPLSVGEHTLTLYVESGDAGVAFVNTWHITVRP